MNFSNPYFALMYFLAICLSYVSKNLTLTPFGMIKIFSGFTLKYFSIEFLEYAETVVTISALDAEALYRNFFDSL